MKTLNKSALLAFTLFSFALLMGTGCASSKCDCPPVGKAPVEVPANENC